MFSDQSILATLTRVIRGARPESGDGALQIPPAIIPGISLRSAISFSPATSGPFDDTVFTTGTTATQVGAGSTGANMLGLNPGIWELWIQTSSYSTVPVVGQSGVSVNFTDNALNELGKILFSYHTQANVAKEHWVYGMIVSLDRFVRIRLNAFGGAGDTCQCSGNASAFRLA